MLQRRHYAVVAAALASIDATLPDVQKVARALVGTNRYFDYDRFMDAALGCPTARDRRAVEKVAPLLKWEGIA